MIRTLLGFAKYTVLNFLTVLPAFAVAIMFETGTGGTNNTVSMLGLVLGIFIIVLFIQVVFMAIFRTRRHWVNSVVAMIVMLLTGVLLASMVFDPEINADYSSVELSFMLNISTEFLGAAVIVILFQLKRIGVVGLLVVGTLFLGLLSRETGQNLELYTNLSAEVFGTLLTGWVIYRMIDFRDMSKSKQKPKNE